MQSLVKFDGKAVALSTISTLTGSIPKIGKLAKAGDKWKRIEILVFQQWEKDGEIKSNAYPITVDVPEGYAFAKAMGAVFFRVRQLVERFPGFQKSKAVNLALSIDGQVVSTSQVQYGGVKGTQFLPAMRKNETYEAYNVRKNDAFRNAATDLMKQVMEVFNPDSETMDETLVQRLGTLASAE